MPTFPVLCTGSVPVAQLGLVRRVVAPHRLAVAMQAAVTTMGIGCTGAAAGESASISRTKSQM